MVFCLLFPALALSSVDIGDYYRYKLSCSVAENGASIEVTYAPDINGQTAYLWQYSDGSAHFRRLRNLSSGGLPFFKAERFTLLINEDEGDGSLSGEVVSGIGSADTWLYAIDIPCKIEASLERGLWHRLERIL